MSLRTVAQDCVGYPEPVGFDYLSRLERGQLMPSVPKLATLASVYGRPISELIDLYEIEELRRLVPKKAGYAMCRTLGIESLERGEITKALACFLGALDAARLEAPDRQRFAVALNNAGHALLKGGRYLTARQYLEEGLRFVDRPGTRARLLDNLANVHYQLDDLLIAELLARAACDLTLEDVVMRPITHATLSAIVLDLKRYPEAEALMRQSLEDYERAGNEIEATRQMYNLGHCLVTQGKLSEGLILAGSAAARAAAREDPHLRATSQLFLGRCLYLAGRKEEAAGPLKVALRIATETSNRNVAFHGAFYLLQLALEKGSRAEEADNEKIARQHRVRLEQRSEEALSFDSWLALRSRKARSRTDA